MNPHYLIDGYNLIHSIPQFRNWLESGLEPARNQLIHFLQGYLSSRQVNITVVFDGEEVGFIEQPPTSNRWLKIIFSKSPEKADPIIKRLIQRTKNKKSLILVSADHELINFSNQNSVQVLSPEEFYDRVSKRPNQTQVDQKFNSQISESEVDEWLKLFEEDSD